jgi:hypothetical protein
LTRSNRPIDSVQDVVAEASAVNRDVVLEVRSPARPWRWLPGVGVLGSLLAFLLLIGGPDPRLANRWGWFWILYVGRPYGIGVLAFLLLGAQRGRPEGELGQRADGFTGFVVAFVAGLALALPASLLQAEVIGSRDGRAGSTYDVPP